jgi:glycosyltransferase involved in cell wall biosynthesis
MALPTLSVIMANYNHARHIPEALRCILDQSVRPMEILVIDDGSSDDSIQVITEIARREPIIKLLANGRNRGIVYSCNRGLALARGEYICGAAADDKVLPDFFAETLTMAAAYPHAGIIFGDMVKVDAEGNVLAYFGLSGPKEKTFFSPRAFLEEYLNVEPPGHSLCGATMYRRDRFLEMGGFSHGLGSWVDTFVTRAIGLKYGACYVPKPFVRWRYEPKSLAHGTTTWEALRIVRRAARLMRSARFRDCFPENYVRRWQDEFRTYLLRQHLVQLPQLRETAFRTAVERAGRTARFLARLERLPFLSLIWRGLPRLEECLEGALTRWFAHRAERRLRSEEKYLYWRLDPALRRSSVPWRLCESVSLPPQRFPPLPSDCMMPDGGHGFRVDLGRLGIFAPSDQESVSLLRLFEDGKLLVGPHYAHEAIRGVGHGRFSHWGNFLYFSASDNSDPRRNGRHYTVETPRTLLSCARAFARSRRPSKLDSAQAA